MNHTADRWPDHTKAARLSRRKTADEAEFIDLQRAALTLNSIGDAVLSTDILGDVTYLNPVAERMTGWTRQEAAGRPIAEVLRIIDATTREPVPNPMEQAIELDRIVGLTPNCLLVSRAGSEMAIEDSASPIRDRRGAVIGAVIVFRDVSEARALSRQAFYLAQHDALTDLPNRVLLDDRLSQAMALARRHGHRLAILFLDLDRFKEVNDSRGHVAGDIVLQSVAQRLLGCVRNSDTVSRQGGDEFVVLLSQITHADDAAASAQTIISAMMAPHDVAHHRIHLTATVGISIYPDDGSDAETLVRCADAAMYRAKDDGRNTYRYFERTQNEPVIERLWRGILSGATVSCPNSLTDDVVRAALADLRLSELPPAPRRSPSTRRSTRVNPFSLDHLEFDPTLAAQWHRTRRAIARLELWRLNPVVLTWNLARSIRQGLGFRVAMHGERY